MRAHRRDSKLLLLEVANEHERLSFEVTARGVTDDTGGALPNLADGAPPTATGAAPAATWMLEPRAAQRLLLPLARFPRESAGAPHPFPRSAAMLERYLGEHQPPLTSEAKRKLRTTHLAKARLLGEAAAIRTAAV